MKESSFLNPQNPQEQPNYNPDQQEPQVHSFTSKKTVALDEQGNPIGLLEQGGYYEQDGKLVKIQGKVYVPDPRGVMVEAQTALENGLPPSYTGKPLTHETMTTCSMCQYDFGRARYLCTQDGNEDCIYTRIGHYLCYDCEKINKKNWIIKYLTFGFANLNLY